ncbi:BON domain-containing protein [Burkholderia semiarida]|uniref:BON domain-containing protein n=1 Tax=Burkholderia semiarida TaxID=2843303 RepID=A0ABW7L6M0_9BURK
MKSRFAIVVAGFVALSPLAGHAQSATAAAPAEQAASAPASPRAAKKAERAADRAFAKKVRQAIVRAPGVGHAQVITVFANAKTGDVTLAGQITDESQDRAAVDAARRVPGVTSVKSRLQLRLEGGQ